MPASTRRVKLEHHLKLLVHTSGCPGCENKNCKAMREHLLHLKSCPNRDKGCQPCKKVLQLVLVHAKSCTKPECPVPSCKRIRETQK